MLRGGDGRVINDHARNTAHCYSPDFSDEYNPARVVPEADHRCEICHRTDNPFSMLLCDGCNLGYHMAVQSNPTGPKGDERSWAREEIREGEGCPD